MDRRIACFEIPTLGIALARLENPSLKGRPVAIAPLHTPRACLHEVSTEAAAEGLHPGMSVEEARRCCPSLRLLPPDPLHVRRADQRLFEVLYRYAPIWEPLRPGHVFLDLTGTTRLFGLATDVAARIEREVLQYIGLTGVVGMGSNKLVSQIAAMLVPPLQVYEVRPGTERPFLAPLPVTVLSRVRHHERTILTTLEDLNLRTLGQIAETPFHQLEAVLGRWAFPLHQWAQGIDPSPVCPPRRQPRIEESARLDPDLVDENLLQSYLSLLLERVCRRLRAQQRACHCLTLTVLYTDEQLVTRRATVCPGSFWEHDLFPRLQALLQRAFRRRVRVRSLMVGAERLAEPVEQISLFADESDGPLTSTQGTRGEGSTGEQRERAHRLMLALDHLRQRHGEQIIHYGRTALPSLLEQKESSLRPAPKNDAARLFHPGRSVNAVVNL